MALLFLWEWGGWVCRLVRCGRCRAGRPRGVVGRVVPTACVSAEEEFMQRIQIIWTYTTDIICVTDVMEEHFEK